MSGRRSFIKKSAIGALGAFLLPKTTKSIMRKNSNIHSSKEFPMVISTWKHGLAANKAAMHSLLKGHKAIDAVEIGVKVSEADPETNSVGYGGWPDRDGCVTLDACIMDETGNCGSVSFLQHIKHPISVARKVMDETPHVMLSGEGALQFALEKGFPKEDLLTEKAEKRWKEWLKESQTEIPEYLDEIIFYLGKSYSTICQGNVKTLLFNGNHETENKNFDQYLNIQGYKFKNTSFETGGYIFLKNKKIALAMDVGPSPEKKFSKDYQCGALSFEIISNDKKLICNSGYFQKNKHKLNDISKSTANHNSLIIDNHSSCKIDRSKREVESGLKILKKNFLIKKNYWNICASHDGYNKRYGVIHERELEYFFDENKFVGQDKLIKKKNFKSTNFEIRFHFEPSTKIMKTQDEKSILIDIENEGWKFSAQGYKIDIETGLYFGVKNSFTENQNLFISGFTQKEDQIIKWEFEKIT